MQQKDKDVLISFERKFIGTSKDLLGLYFDFMQNLHLIKIPVQGLFHLRQSALNIFS
jgi:hypothetical protein